MTALVEELKTKVAFIDYYVKRPFEFSTHWLSYFFNEYVFTQVGSIVQGGGPKAVERHTSKGKLLARSEANQTD